VAEIAVRTPHAVDIGRLVAGMRAADVAEMEAFGLTDRAAVVRQSVSGAAFCHAFVVDGELAGIGGLGRWPGGEGCPWFLGTPVVRRRARSLMRPAAAYIARMLRVYPVLLNFVHAENTVAVAWLRHLKFEVQPAAPYGSRGALFHRFEMRR
jgi:hypothetical protein